MCAWGKFAGGPVMQALVGPSGQSGRFARTARGMGMLPQLQDYEPGKGQQLQAKHREASQEAAQQRLQQSSILQGTQCRV